MELTFPYLEISSGTAMEHSPVYTLSTWISLAFQDRLLYRDWLSSGSGLICLIALAIYLFIHVKA